MHELEIILILSLIGASYSYFIYPLLLLILPKKNNFNLDASTLNQNALPYLTLIITAYNEETRIKEKIKNTLELDYPLNKREILVASDGSTDNTNQFVQEYRDEGVKLIEVTDRKGKENAQLAAIKKAHGDLLVFSDVATKIPKEALIRIANTFENKDIGALSSEDRFITDNGEIAGEGAYVRYEMWLRNLEAKVKSLVGLSGSFFACRKAICKDWDIKVPSDFNTALNCVAQGYVAISHQDVLGYYPNLKDESKEYQRKLRTVIRGMAAISEKPSVLNPFKFGLFSFEVFSHKIMRWLVPWFQLILFITSIIMWQDNILISLLLLAQILFYSIATLGAFSKRARKNSIVKIPFFFMQVNMAIAQASILFLTGRRITKWEPSKR